MIKLDDEMKKALTFTEEEKKNLSKPERCQLLLMLTVLKRHLNGRFTSEE